MNRRFSSHPLLPPNLRPRAIFVSMSDLMAKNKTLKFGNTTIHPGESVALALPLPELYTCAPIYMPVQIIHGKQEGPTLLVCAAKHGNELNGGEIIRRLEKLSLLKNLRGTLIMVPVINVYGLINRSRYLPGGFDLDHYFPGKENGSLAERLAYLFTKEVLSRADYVIDIETGSPNHLNLPQIHVNPEWPNIQALAKAFQAPVVMHTETEEGTIRFAANQMHKTLLVYEAGEALRFNEKAIKVGVQGIINIMRHTEMLPEKTAGAKKFFEPTIAQSCRWITAPQSGIVRSQIKLGQQVSTNEKLAQISDPFTNAQGHDVITPYSGVVVGVNHLPLVQEGETLFQIATFERVATAADQIKAWSQIQSEA